MTGVGVILTGASHSTLNDLSNEPLAKQHHYFAAHKM